MFTLRFDMRAPQWGAPIEELYGAAIDIAAWAETRGAIVAVLSEHHATKDRHLPSPLMLASAIAARTETLPILVAAAVLPFYETTRLAEDMAVLDIISRGRIAYVLGVGHRREEFEHFDLDPRGRGALADEQLARLIDLLSGGDSARSPITPAPTSGGPQLFVGGGSLSAARRAGRFGLGLIAQASVPGLTDTYEQACAAAGHEPGFVQMPVPGQATAMFVTDDVELAWSELGAHMLHDATTAASYRRGEESVASISAASTIEELREDPSYRVVTVDEAADLVRQGTILPLLPLCGGLDPDLAWKYLGHAVTACEQAESAQGASDGRTE